MSLIDPNELNKIKDDFSSALDYLYSFEFERNKEFFLFTILAPNGKNIEGFEGTETLANFGRSPYHFTIREIPTVYGLINRDITFTPPYYTSILTYHFLTRVLALIVAKAYEFHLIEFLLFDQTERKELGIQEIKDISLQEWGLYTLFNLFSWRNSDFKGFVGKTLNERRERVTRINQLFYSNKKRLSNSGISDLDKEIWRKDKEQRERERESKSNDAGGSIIQELAEKSKALKVEEKSQEQLEQEEWASIDKIFKVNPDLINLWKKEGFDVSQVKDFIEIGFKAEEYKLIAWIQSDPVKKIDAQKIFKGVKLSEWKRRLEFLRFDFERRLNPLPQKEITIEQIEEISHEVISSEAQESQKSPEKDERKLLEKLQDWLTSKPAMFAYSVVLVLSFSHFFNKKKRKK